MGGFSMHVERKREALIPETSFQSLQVGMEWFPEAPGSGVGRMYHGLIRHLPEEGVEVSGLVTGSPQVSASDEPIQAFAASDAALPRRLWSLRSAVRTRIEETRPDLVASHFALYTLPYVDRLDGTPLVAHFHGPWARESEAEGASPLVVRLKESVERLAYRRAQRFIVLSEAFKSVLVRTYDVSENRVRVVPGGVDVDRFDSSLSPADARTRLGWPSDRPILLTVRRLVRRVGLENLVDAMQYVRHHVPDALLLIAGKGPLTDALRARIQDHDLDDHVRLLGFVPDEDLPVAYRAADVSVVPTRSLEGFGLVAVESLAAGTPVLVTPVGGLPEVVRKLSPGLVMEGSSTEALQDHIVAALDGSLSLPGGADCRAFAAAHYDWPVIARQVRAVYEEVL